MEVLILLGAGAPAGIFGSLLGLGGGILIVPLLTLGVGLPIREAVGVSLVCVIVTSGAAAGVYLERHTANLRLGMLLELFTATGALVGGLVAFLLSDRVLAGLFAALLAYTAATMLRAAVRRPSTAAATSPAGHAAAPAGDDGGLLARLSGPGYRIGHIRTGIAGAILAGLVSALLGVGGGIVKVPVMNLVMGVPLRVATATSNLMIGVTATASAVIYLLRGGIDAYVAGPTAMGVFVGATIGSRIAGRIDVRLLRFLFIAVQLYVAVQMVQRALGGAR